VRLNKYRVTGSPKSLVPLRNGGNAPNSMGLSLLTNRSLIMTLV